MKQPSGDGPTDHRRSASAPRVAPPCLRGRPVCEKQLTMPAPRCRSLRRSPAPARPAPATARFLGVQTSAKAINAKQTRSPVTAECSKTSDERFSLSLCHKKNFQTRTSLTVHLYFRLPHLYFSLEHYDPHVNRKFTNTPIVLSLAVTSTSPIALCDSQRRTNVLTRHSDLPFRFFSIWATMRTCPGMPSRLCQATNLLGPITLCSHTIKDGLKIATSSFRVQHPKQQHGC